MQKETKEERKARYAANRERREKEHAERMAEWRKEQAEKLAQKEKEKAAKLAEEARRRAEHDAQQEKQDAENERAVQQYNDHNEYHPEIVEIYGEPMMEAAFVLLEGEMLSLHGVDELLRLIRKRPEMPYRVVFGDMDAINREIAEQIKKSKEKKTQKGAQ